MDNKLVEEFLNDNEEYRDESSLESSLLTKHSYGSATDLKGTSNY